MAKRHGQHRQAESQRDADKTNTEFGNAAANTADPHPPNTSHAVPMNSATSLRVMPSPPFVSTQAEPKPVAGPVSLDWRHFPSRCVSTADAKGRNPAWKFKNFIGGRLVDIPSLVVRDLAASRRFHGSHSWGVGCPDCRWRPGFFWADEFVVSSVTSPAALGQLTGRNHVAFQAKDRATVEKFYQAGLANGGKDFGAPGMRPYHPGYYAAFLLDPDGNNIEAVFLGDAIAARLR